MSFEISLPLYPNKMCSRHNVMWGSIIRYLSYRVTLSNDINWNIDFNLNNIFSHKYDHVVSGISGWYDYQESIDAFKDVCSTINFSSNAYNASIQVMAIAMMYIHCIYLYRLGRKTSCESLYYNALQLYNSTYPEYHRVYENLTINKRQKDFFVSELLNCSSLIVLSFIICSTFMLITWFVRYQ